MDKLGEGISAIVYTDGQFAYKKYKEGYSIDNMRFEVAVQNEIYHHTKLHVAEYKIVDDMIQMTLLKGKNLADRIINDNYQQGFLDFINLQVEYVLYKNLNLADSYETFAYQIKTSKLDETLKKHALQSIDDIEKTYHLCHFDFHPENIMYHEDIPYIIDWTNAKLGNPVMDIASTYIIFRLYADDFSKPYLDAMISKGFALDKIIKAIPVMAFIRLRETKEEHLVNQLRLFVLGLDDIFTKSI